MLDFDDEDSIDEQSAYSIREEEVERWLAENVCDLCGHRLDRYQQCPICDANDRDDMDDSEYSQW